jgi:FkbM family methyltransferase
VRIPNADQRRTAIELLLPGFAIDLMRARSFGRSHGFDVAGLRGYRNFREARRFGIDLLPDGLSLDHVVDVGANEGQFASALLAIAPNAHIDAFEPEIDTAARLHRQFGDDPRVTIHRQAVSAGEGTANFNVSSNSVFSSLRTPLPQMTDYYPRGADVLNTIIVPTVALDDVIHTHVSLLKIDVQGAEREVLVGAARVLAETDAVLLEMNFLPHYGGEATFAELHEQMLGLAFQLHAIGLPRRTAAGSCLLWADACYVRRHNRS